MNVGTIALGILLLIAVGYTIYGYPHKYGALTGRSRLYRTVGLCIIDLLLMLVLMGTFIDFRDGVTPTVGAIRWAFYWGACLVLGLMLPLIAALDALESFVAMRREQREFLDKIVRDELERATSAAAKKPPSLPPDEKHDDRN
jgi:hypothetical protein